MDTDIEAIRIRQKSSSSQEPVTMYLAALPAGQLLEMSQIDAWRMDNPEGYQRPLVEARLRDVAYFVTQEEGVLPTSILLGVRGNDSTRFTGKEHEGSPACQGTLTIKEGTPLWVIDGQHRLFGIKKAIDEDSQDSLCSYPLPVTIIDGIDRFMEMRHFYLVNKRQKGVPTDMVDVLIDQMRQKQGLEMKEGMGRLTSVQDKEYRRARAVRVAMLLSEVEGPWKSILRLPADRTRGKASVRLHTMVSSLEPALKDTYIGGVPDDDLTTLVNNYWKAACGLWRGAAENPNEYNLLRTSGLYSLHMVLPDIITRCREFRDFSQDRMGSILEATGIDSSFWHKDKDLMIGTNMGALRHLAVEIRERLPRLALPGLHRMG